MKATTNIVFLRVNFGSSALSFFTSFFAKPYSELWYSSYPMLPMSHLAQHIRCAKDVRQNLGFSNNHPSPVQVRPNSITTPFLDVRVRICLNKENNCFLWRKNQKLGRKENQTFNPGTSEIQGVNCPGPYSQNKY